jgi:hypothetical protein
MTEDFITRWRGIIATGGSGKTEVDSTHPLRFIVGVDDRNQPMIFVIVADKPPMPELSGVISVERRQRASDGKWTLALSLTDRRFLDAYLQLAADLVNRTAGASSEVEGMASMFRVIAEWQRLLARGPRAPLSEIGLRGLIAELWFGFCVLPREEAPPKIATAWQGPFGSHQDYVFPLGRRYEVKSRRQEAETIRISSPEQLDASNLILTTATLVEVDPGLSGSISLPELVDQIRSELASTPDAALIFDRGLDALDVDPGDSHYADRCYMVTECSEYEVTEDFPSVRRSSLPNSIVAATYDISISALEGFMINRWQPTDVD